MRTSGICPIGRELPRRHRVGGVTRRERKRHRTRSHRNEPGSETKTYRVTPCDQTRVMTRRGCVGYTSRRHRGVSARLLHQLSDIDDFVEGAGRAAALRSVTARNSKIASSVSPSRPSNCT